MSAALTVIHGTLHVGSLSGVTVTGDDSGALTLSGNAASVNTVLAGLTYTPIGDYEGADTLNLSVTSKDGTNTYPTPATTSTAITVNPVADAPSATAPPALTLNENATSVQVTGVSVGPIAEDSDDSVSAALTVIHGSLHVGSLSGVTMTGDDSGALTLSGNAASVNTVLAGLTYTPTSQYEGADTLNLSVTSKDGTNTYPTPATTSTAITVSATGPQYVVTSTLDTTIPARCAALSFLPTRIPARPSRSTWPPTRRSRLEASFRLSPPTAR